MGVVFFQKKTQKVLNKFPGLATSRRRDSAMIAKAENSRHFARFFCRLSNASSGFRTLDAGSDRRFSISLYLRNFAR